MSDILSRITPSVMDTQVLTGLQGNQQLISQLSQQLATGNLINQPSDNPVGAVQTLSIQSALSRSQQYQANAADGLSRLQVANSALTSAMSQLQQINSLVASVGNSVTDASGLPSVATQVAQLEQSLVATANTTYEGQQVFAGASGSTIAYSVTPSVGGVVGSASYQGSGVAPSRSVAPGVSASAGIVAPFGTGSTGNVFNVLNQLVADLQSGNVSAVTGTDATALRGALSQVNQAAGQVGALYDQMQTLQGQAQKSTQQLQEELANLQSANLAQVSSSYAQAQTNYQSALYAAAEVTKLPSLVSFL